MNIRWNTFLKKVYIYLHMYIDTSDETEITSLGRMSSSDYWVARFIPRCIENIS